MCEIISPEQSDLHIAQRRPDLLQVGGLVGQDSDALLHISLYLFYYRSTMGDDGSSSGSDSDDIFDLSKRKHTAQPTKPSKPSNPTLPPVPQSQSEAHSHCSNAQDVVSLSREKTASSSKTYSPEKKSAINKLFLKLKPPSLKRPAAQLRTDKVLDEDSDGLSNRYWLVL